MILVVFLGISFRYATAQDDSCVAIHGTAAVGKFLATLQTAVATDERVRVAQMVRFPIKITLRGKQLTLRNRQDLLKYYDVAFDSKVKGFIAEQRPSDLFCNWQGIMIGRGEIWFGAVGPSKVIKIIAINNNPPWSPDDPAGETKP